MLEVPKFSRQICGYYSDDDRKIISLPGLSERKYGLSRILARSSCQSSGADERFQETRALSGWLMIEVDCIVISHSVEVFVPGALTLGFG